LAGDRFVLLDTPVPGQQRIEAQGGMITTAIARAEEHRSRAVSNIFPGINNDRPAALPPGIRQRLSREGRFA
jgi:hypothetical protein